jgi:hypothetical protein
LPPADPDGIRLRTTRTEESAPLLAGEAGSQGSRMSEAREEPAVERPLVTFYVATYNQEAYVRAAVESAFAQTYRPL